MNSHQIVRTFQVCLVVVNLVCQCYACSEEGKSASTPNSSTFLLNMKSIIGLTEAELVELGNRYIKQRKYDRAIQAFSEAINKNDRKASYYVLRGNCYDTKRYDTKAAEDFEKAVKLVMESGKEETLDVDTDSFLQIGRTLYYNGKYDEAVWCFTEIINKNNSDTECYYLRQKAYDKMGEWDKAILDLKKLLELETDASLKRHYRRNLIAGLIKARRCEEALNETLLLSGNPTYTDDLVRTCRQLNHKNENVLSIRCYNELMNIVSNNAAYYEERGSIYLELKDIDAAISDFKTSITLEPIVSSFWNKLLDTLVSSGKSYDVIMEGKVKELRLRMQIGRVALTVLFRFMQDIRAVDDDAIESLGNAFFQRNRCKYALIFYNEAIRRKPSDDQNFERRGRCYLNMNDTDAAMNDFKEVMRIEPYNAFVRFKLKDVLLESEKYKELVDVASMLHDEAEIAFICNKLFERNAWEEASRCFTEALKKSPGKADNYEKRALCNLSLKRTEEVVSDLENARKIRPLRDYIELHLCEALIELKRYEEAAKILENIDRNKDPEFTDSSLERISQARQIIAEAHGSTIVANPATVNAKCS